MAATIDINAPRISLRLLLAFILIIGIILGWVGSQLR